MSSVSGWVMWEARSENVVGIKVQQCQNDREEQTIFSLGVKFKSLGALPRHKALGERCENDKVE